MKHVKSILSIVRWPTLFFLFFTNASVLLAQGLPGEYLLTQRWRDLAAKYSPLTNPALLMEENYKTARLIVAPTMQGEYKLWETGLTVPIGLYHTAGFSWNGQNSSQYSEIINNEPSGRKVGYQENYFTLTYALNPWNGLCVGSNAAIVHQNAFTEQRVSFGADAGISYRLRRHALLGNHILGISMQNLLAPSDGTDAFSRICRLTWFYDILDGRLYGKISFDIKDLLTSSNKFTSDATNKLPWDICASLSYNFLGLIQVTPLFGFDAEGFEYLSMATAINIPSMNNGRDIAAAYQYGALRDNEASWHTVYLRGEFGLHREAAYAKAMAKKVDIAPNNLYIKALQYYRKGEYWNAFLLFNRILSEYPDFFKNDWVTYYVGSCQELMDMREAATQSYMAVRKGFPRSSAIPSADLGLMRIYYREEKYNEMAIVFSQLNQPTVDDDIKYEAYYYMGQSYIALKDPQQALEYLNAIPQGHREYIFAQHSIAVALLSIGKADVAAVILQDITQIAPKTRDEQQIIDRSYLLIGYMLYHNMIEHQYPLSLAISVLRKVPKTSIYYEEAVLGQAWCVIKAKQWNDLLANAQILSGSSNTIFQLEGNLLLGYAYIMMNDYTEAAKAIKTAEEKMNWISGPQQKELMVEKQKYFSTRTSYDFIAKRALELARSTQTAATIALLDSLHNHQVESKKFIDNSLRFFDSFKRAELFARSLPNIKEDIVFTTAFLSKKLAGVKTEKAIRKIDRQEETIDKQIEQLQDELKKMDNKNE